MLLLELHWDVFANILKFCNLQIYVLMYKEVTIALKINSLYSKRRLLNIHENVKVLRYPDHFSSGVYLWYVMFPIVMIYLKGV
jgi:phospholipase D1/2